MDKKRLQKLLIEYSSNKIQTKDYNELMDFITLPDHDAELYAFMEKIWNSRPVEQSFSDLQSDMLYQRIIGDRRFDRKPAQKRRTGFKLWQSIAAAAIILITLSVTLFFYTKNNTFIGLGTPDYVKYDVKPGGNNAVLTLADGRKIELTAAANGKIAEQAGLSIEKTADGQLVYEVSPKANAREKEVAGYNTIETPKGGQYQVNLPDGTKVWLNAASSLKFPSFFKDGSKRVVELSGEGYFEVAKVSTVVKGAKGVQRMPFIVRTNDQDVEVLGTHFNISNYANDAETKTTLLEGLVKVEKISPATRNAVAIDGVILKPGQQASLKGGRLNVKYVDVDTEIAWKNGSFVFKNEDMRSIMRKVERWYDVEIIISNEINNRSFEGSISRFKNVSEILRKFELTGNIHFKMKGRRITVMP